MTVAMNRIDDIFTHDYGHTHLPIVMAFVINVLGTTVEHRICKDFFPLMLAISWVFFTVTVKFLADSNETRIL